MLYSLVGFRGYHCHCLTYVGKKTLLCRFTGKILAQRRIYLEFICYIYIACQYRRITKRVHCYVGLHKKHKLHYWKRRRGKILLESVLPLTWHECNQKLLADVIQFTKTFLSFWNNNWKRFIPCPCRPVHDDLVGELRRLPAEAWGQPPPQEARHLGHPYCWGQDHRWNR